MRTMQVIDYRSFGPIDFKLIESFSAVLPSLCNFTQIELGNRSLFHTNGIGKFCKQDRKILDISWHRLSVAPAALRNKGARHADDTCNRTNNVVTEINTVGAHISDLA